MDSPAINKYMKKKSNDYRFNGKGITDIKYDNENNILTAKIEKKDFEIKGIGFNSDLVLDVEVIEPSLLIKKREKKPEKKLDIEETKL